MTEVLWMARYPGPRGGGEIAAAITKNQPFSGGSELPLLDVIGMHEEFGWVRVWYIWLRGDLVPVRVRHSTPQLGALKRLEWSIRQGIWHQWRVLVSRVFVGSRDVMPVEQPDPPEETIEEELDLEPLPDDEAEEVPEELNPPQEEIAEELRELEEGVEEFEIRSTEEEEDVDPTGGDPPDDMSDKEVEEFLETHINLHGEELDRSPVEGDVEELRLDLQWLEAGGLSRESVVEKWQGVEGIEEMAKTVLAQRNWDFPENEWDEPLESGFGLEDSDDQ